MQKVFRVCEVISAGSPLGRVIAQARDGSTMTVELPTTQLSGFTKGCLLVADINIHPGWDESDSNRWLTQFLRGQ